MTATPGKVHPEVRSAAEQSERTLRALTNLEPLLGKLAHQLMDEGDPLQAGIVAATTQQVRSAAALIDLVAAKYNDRLRKDGLHGVREDAEHQTGKVEQMQLL